MYIYFRMTFYYHCLAYPNGCFIYFAGHFRYKIITKTKGSLSKIITSFIYVFFFSFTRWFSEEFHKYRGISGGLPGPYTTSILSVLRRFGYILDTVSIATLNFYLTPCTEFLNFIVCSGLVTW